MFFIKFFSSLSQMKSRVCKPLYELRSACSATQTFFCKVQTWIQNSQFDWVWLPSSGWENNSHSGLVMVAITVAWVYLKVNAISHICYHYQYGSLSLISKLAECNEFNQTSHLQLRDNVRMVLHTRQYTHTNSDFKAGNKIVHMM